jgi:hypothetical protein
MGSSSALSGARRSSVSSWLSIVPFILFLISIYIYSRKYRLCLDISSLSFDLFCFLQLGRSGHRGVRNFWAQVIAEKPCLGPHRRLSRVIVAIRSRERRGVCAENLAAVTPVSKREMNYTPMSEKGAFLLTLTLPLTLFFRALRPPFFMQLKGLQLGRSGHRGVRNSWAQMIVRRNPAFAGTGAFAGYRNELRKILDSLKR